MARPRPALSPLPALCPVVLPALHFEDSPCTDVDSLCLPCPHGAGVPLAHDLGRHIPRGLVAPLSQGRGLGRPVGPLLPSERHQHCCQGIAVSAEGDGSGLSWVFSLLNWLFH